MQVLYCIIQNVQVKTMQCVSVIFHVSVWRHPLNVMRSSRLLILLCLFLYRSAQRERVSKRMVNLCSRQSLYSMYGFAL